MAINPNIYFQQLDRMPRNPMSNALQAGTQAYDATRQRQMQEQQLARQQAQDEQNALKFDMQMRQAQQAEQEQNALRQTMGRIAQGPSQQQFGNLDRSGATSQRDFDIQQLAPFMSPQQYLAETKPGQPEKPVSPFEGLQPAYETYLRGTGQPNSPQAYAAWQKNVTAQKRAGAPKTTVTQTLGGEKLTPGQKKIDENYAAEYIEWEAAGGYADHQKLVAQLRDVSAQLGSGMSLSGPILGSTPDAVLKFTNPEVIANRERVEEVVQRNLRAVLGAQFTEKEGERLIKRAFNPNLSEAENKKRVDSLTQQMELAGQAKDSAAQYMRQNGTLRGWSGRQPAMRDFFAAMDGKNKDYGVVDKGQAVTTQAQYDKLPSGAIYTEDGQRYRKP